MRGALVWRHQVLSLSERDIESWQAAERMVRHVPAVVYARRPGKLACTDASLALDMPWMKGQLRLQAESGVWRVRWSPTLRAEAKDDRFELPSLHDCRQRGRELMRELWFRMGPEAGVWRLEFSKSCSGKAEVELGCLGLFVDGCLSGKRPHASVVPGVGWEACRRAAILITSAGNQAKWLSVGNGLLALSWFATGMVASISVLWSAFRFGSARDLGAHREPLLALHGEWSTRTRHILSAIPVDGRTRAVLLLGRPRRTAAEVRKIWANALSRDALQPFWPISLFAAWQALPTAARLVAEGLKWRLSIPYRLSARAQLACQYRAVWGAASARWWQVGTASPEVAVFGHTGLADTTLLELAMQRRGAKTLHIVHGVSSGLNFTGVSSEAWFRCRFDARWHERLGGYGKCAAKEQAQAITASPGSAPLVLALTNHAHPMNAHYPRPALDDEVWALQIIAESVRRVYGGIRLVWRPHPTFEHLGEEEKAWVSKRAEALGFVRAVKSNNALYAARDARAVICTMSTVVLEMLSLGVVPIVIDVQHEDPECALAHYPFVARNEVDLTRVLLKLQSQDSQDEALHVACSLLGPGRVFEFNDVST